ncbi:hypothetical protein IKW75_03625 [Candidatus Saccharibacteria bacterium]|nr:hypothetical protein [Candidatus Saccharibacteria bacterium]
MQRLIIVYNPRSSKHARIEREVIRPISKLGGYQIGKFEIARALVDENAAKLASILQDGDLVVTAGGDGTSTVGVNAIMLSGKDVTLGVLGYGNFNDFPRMLGEEDYVSLISDFENGAISKMYPLEAMLDGKRWRYAAAYFTVGMFAESTEAFENPRVRGKLKKGRKGLLFSIKTLAMWYFSHRKHAFLPKEIQLDGEPMNKMKASKSGRINIVKTPIEKQISDVMFVNGKTVAKVMRGGNYWTSNTEFLVSFGRLKSFPRLVGFMLTAMFARLPGKKVDGSVKLSFASPEEFEIQAEGEYQRVKAKELVVRKVERGIKVVCR